MYKWILTFEFFDMYQNTMNLYIYSFLWTFPQSVKQCYLWSWSQWKSVEDVWLRSKGLRRGKVKQKIHWNDVSVRVNPAEKQIPGEKSVMRIEFRSAKACAGRLEDPARLSKAYGAIQASQSVSHPVNQPPRLSRKSREWGFSKRYAAAAGVACCFR